MGDVLQIQWGSLDMLLEDMVTIKEQVTDMDTYVEEHVCSTAGFDFEPFALKPLADAMGEMRGYFSTMKSTFETRFEGLQAATIMTAKHVYATDETIKFDFDKLTGEPGQGDGGGPGIEVRLVGLRDPADRLTAPEEGKQKFPKGHDEPFQEVVSGWDAARDKVNECIKWCRDHGIDIFEELPDKSLEDFIVFPLSGDYYAIQQNSSACKKLAKAFRDYAVNFGLLAGNAIQAMKGQAGSALNLHIALYGAVMTAISGVIDGLAGVFESLATMSERIAMKVEKIIRVLAQKLFKLMRFLLKRINAVIGILTTVKEIAEKGTAFFTDLVEDVKTVKNLIEVAFGLATEVEEWAREQADRIKTVKQVVRIVSKLPHARAKMNLNDLPSDTGDIEKSLKDLKTDFGDPEGTAYDDLEDKVDEGVAEAGKTDPSVYYDEDCEPDSSGPNSSGPVNPLTGEPEEWHPPMAPPSVIAPQNDVKIPQGAR
ncbi:hypothetical protein [Nocardioides sp. cx-173]|uniref:hypothetical protein n=1 Tax=Nocardioides sp. cx-173 TaxID=2898796 RepID=UPI001E57E6D1|nr:hypothetical protein [Nocardioides sp. cx-173]MCD4525707.1 hypothetical protein [Nocardioides sp. cx-173]UGB42845.1 hypothetical protein LQ940_04800 [Nocardioides sp. cx-173]